MRGIKECTAWMIDNPNKELNTDYCYNVFYDGVSFKIKWKDGSVVENSDFRTLEEHDWKPVKKPVDFETARYQCKEYGHKFAQYDYEITGMSKEDIKTDGKKGTMYKSGSGVAIITSGEYSSVRVDGDWYIEE